MKVIKISSREASLNQFKNRGHMNHVAGVGAHRNKKAYNRKQKHKRLWTEAA